MPTTEIMAALSFAQVSFRPFYRQEYSRQAGGNPRVSDIGPEVWIADIRSNPMYNDDAEALAAVFAKMRGSLDTFYVWNPRRPYPRMDPTGSILGSNVVTISALGGDNKSLSLAGLPAGYVISAGDLIAWDYGSPTHRALHQFVAGGTASGGGALGSTEVAPHIRPGSVTGTTVILKRPAAEMMLLPGSYDFPTGPAVSAVAFQAVQIP